MNELLFILLVVVAVSFTLNWLLTRELRLLSAELREFTEMVLAKVRGDQ